MEKDLFWKFKTSTLKAEIVYFILINVCSLVTEDDNFMLQSVCAIFCANCVCISSVFGIIETFTETRFLSEETFSATRLLVKQMGRNPVEYGQALSIGLFFHF